ncbi:MAG: short chain dehydrogenase, partial [Gallionellaceae bacterium]|nr:short chain dehydrogenase [Gallionellaceae bacterium]
ASQACIPHLKKAANPHILTLSPPLNLEAKWFAPHVVYTISKYGMSMVMLGLAKEFAADGIACNCLWPRTTIATAAIEFNFPPEILRASRKPTIMADAAHAILLRDSKTFSGHFFIDDEVIRASGVKNLDQYAVCPGEQLYGDLFLERGQ